MNQEVAMKKQQLIFVPLPFVGHMASLLEFATRLLNQNDQIMATVLLMKLPLSSFLDSYVKTVAYSNPTIQFIELPQIHYPPEELMAKAFISYVDAVMESYKPHVRSVVSEIISLGSRSKQSTRVAALVLDNFCGTMIDIGNEFGIPSYAYITSGAGILSLMLSPPRFHEEVGREFKNSDFDLSLPGFANPVPVRVLPSTLFNTDGDYSSFVKITSRLRDAQGIVVNTYEELESRAINSLADEETPPVYPVGPVVNLKGWPHPELDRARWDKIMKWLDEQPQTSVLFLCFGSAGFFSLPQVEEIALGLEKSGHRFLWCLRAPPGIQVKNPEEMLPKGFLERIGERGIVCRWARQVEVLGHKSIGGFMSHCGWNSILESLWYGVPIVTWPIYAEQQLNAFLMVKELGLAEELRMDYCPDHFVRADDIARAVERVIQSDSVVRKKVKEMGEMARKAVMDGGSSSASIAKFIKNITNSSS